jgi:spermidine synthase
VLRIVFFLSGAAALVFETLWFRLTRLAFGNSVAASAIVLASFMAGLALGNAAAAWRGHRSRRPIRAYAVLELVTGVTGLALVLALPRLASLLAPAFAAVALGSATLHGLRLALSFGILLVPATAMGATLPLLVSALSRSRDDFGPTLGSLYGWNTLGAVAGALLGEWVLIGALGVGGSAFVAALFNGVAALGAWWTERRSAADAPTREPPPEARVPGRAGGLIAAAALAGGLLLGLEVVWFRFLQLFVFGSSRAFATMLSVVVLGIALGGLLAARWLSARPEAHRWRSLLALGAGIATAATYACFTRALSALGVDYTGKLGVMLPWSAALMLPTSLLSGLLFTMLGRAIRDEVGPASRAAGLLTVANTLGAMGGSLVAGFVLLPRLGVEASLFLLSLGYLLVFVTALPPVWTSGALKIAHGLALFAFVGLAAAFPFGLMKSAYLPRVVARFNADAARLVAVREGQAETLLYLRKDVLGEPLTCRMVTNGFSMSGLGFFTERYMRTFVNWALALRPSASRALLISYGVGVTASALADEPRFRSIDLVDISKDVIEMAGVCVRSGAAHPLRDPRVRVHIEDGRFFLLTTRERFDLITAEPPPPQAAGVETLYSREYFAMLRDRLAEGGITTYWLPVHSMDRPGALAVIRGFCDVFEDCSLWNGAGFNWMLAGSRGGLAPVPLGEFSRQWQDPAVALELRAIGLEGPQDLGGMFLGDAPFLRELARGAEPLVDDRPYRLSTSEETDSFEFFLATMDARAAAARFAASPWIARVWPVELRQHAAEAFVKVGLFNDLVQSSYTGKPRRQLETLRRALLETTSSFLPLVVMGSQPVEQAIASRARERGEEGSVLDYLDGAGAMARRDYAAAERLMAKVLRREPDFARAAAFRALALCMEGEGDAFRAQARPAGEPADAAFWAALEPECLKGRSPAAARP